jgi:hypothetical protein
LEPVQNTQEDICDEIPPWKLFIICVERALREGLTSPEEHMQRLKRSIIFEGCLHWAEILYLDALEENPNESSLDEIVSDVIGQFAGCNWESYGFEDFEKKLKQALLDQN